MLRTKDGRLVVKVIEKRFLRNITDASVVGIINGTIVIRLIRDRSKEGVWSCGLWVCSRDISMSRVSYKYLSHMKEQ